MRQAALLLLALAPLAHAAPKTHTVKLNGHTFTLPEGFTIELAAKTPLVDRPIVASFDDKGRLYVADSSGSNEKPDAQLKNPTHRIMRLEDTKGTGVYDKATVFADKMMFPEGILWHKGSVFVGAPPHIWKLTDTDDDGKADKREVWFDGKTLTGCANDLHGPYLGPDGYIYWCKGAFAKQTYTLPNGKPFTTRASHIFRAKPDGTNVEPVMTGGMDNPVAVAFLPNGERFFTTTFLQHPAAGKRDGIIHAVYGGIYGKDHDVIYDADHKWTSPNVMPVMTHLGPAAPCGLHCLTSNEWGKDYLNNLFCCQFNLRKVSRHVLKPSGSTYTTDDSDFVVSDNQDFHPTDVIEEADGSLLIVDTGGWYKLCCPSSQLVKTDVLGAIYRVRKSDQPKNRRHRQSMTNWESLDKAYFNKVGAELLSDPKEAFDRLSNDLVSLSLRGDSKHGRLFILHVLNLVEKSRLDADVADQIRQSAAHVLGVWRNQSSVTKLTEMLWLQDNLITRRIAAEALGRIGDKAAVPDLLHALSVEMSDRTLEHAITYALIEIGSDEALTEGLKNQNPTVRRCVMVARDQLGLPNPVNLVTLGLKSPDAAFQEAAWWIVSRHPERVEHLMPVIRQRLTDPAIKPAEWDTLAACLAKLTTTPVIQQLLADLLLTAPADIAKQRLFPLMRQSGVREMPKPWAAVFKTLLSKPDGELTDAVLETVRRLPRPKEDVAGWNKLFLTISTTAKSEATRVHALAALLGTAAEFSDAQIQMVLKQLVSAEAKSRSVAADALSRVKWTDAQLMELVHAVPAVTVTERERVLAVFQQTTSEPVGLALLKQMNAPEWRGSLRVDQVRGTFAKYGEPVKAEAEKLNALLNADLKQQTATLEAIAKRLPAGDVRRGQAVFNSAKTSCIACHTIGYVGGKIGPDLTRIGGIRTERDLLESILYPSASFVRSYEPLNVKTTDGRVFNGVPKKDAPDELILTIAADKEVRLDRKEIEEVTPGKVSVMPAGLAQQITEQELADLIAFLRGCK